MNQAAIQQAQAPFAPMKRLEYARRLAAFAETADSRYRSCVWALLALMVCWTLLTVPWIPIGVWALASAVVFAAVGGQERRARREAGLMCPHCNRLFLNKVAEAVLFTDRCGYCKARLLAD